jgi:cyclopropane-fatty-acyl-phospholipid synthase
MEFFVQYVQKFVPTSVLRWAIRLTFRYVGWQIRRGDVVVKQIQVDRVERISKPVTAEVDVTNEQLYANDPNFFLAHLGPMLKYSSCEWPKGIVKNLAEAEVHTVAVYQRHVGLHDLPNGARVLELGCGWGSLTLHNAAKFPHLHFVSFSNSPPQIDYIRTTAKARGLTNVTVFVEDYSVFVDSSKSTVAPEGSPLFDAAVAIETVEHAQNIRELLVAVARRLKPGSKFFVQSLLHQSSSYLLDDGSWMGRNFFTAGSILSLNSYFHLSPPELYISEMIPVNGKVMK